MSNIWTRLINDNGPVSPQQISDFDQSRRDLREAITIYNKPLLTIHLFLLASLSFTYYGIQYVITNSIFLYLILPSLLLWLLLDHIPGPYTEALNSIEFSVEYFVWWVGLGILSSIGLGSGLQSGMLFLFPHIIKVSLAAQTCKTLDFESVTDIWFRSPKTLFKCPPLTEHSTPVTLFGIWEKIIFVCFLQSAGTAIGEIPPYWMTRAARLAAIESGADNNKDIHMPEELETNSKFSLVNKAKLWMIWLLKTHGFYGVLLMASYPNIAFDLCGICCGHFLMPFWTFFGATFIGKAIVRNTYQSIIYVVLCRYSIVLYSMVCYRYLPDHMPVYLLVCLFACLQFMHLVMTSTLMNHFPSFCSEEYMEVLIRSLQHVVPDSFQLDQRIREVLEEGRESFKSIGNKNNGVIYSSSGSGSNISGGDEAKTAATAAVGIEMSTGAVFLFWWKILMCTLLCLFFVSCVSQFAQYYQMTLDQADSNKLRKRLPSNVRMELVSPSSGRLKLPPPTPSTKGKALLGRDVHATTAGSNASSLNKDAQPKLELIPSSRATSDPQTAGVPDSKKRE